MPFDRAREMDGFLSEASDSCMQSDVNSKYSGETLMFASAICPFSNGLAISFILLLVLPEKLMSLCDILA